MRDDSPLPFIAMRFVLAGGLLLVALARGRLERSALGPGFVLGLSLFACYVFQTAGLVYTTPSKSAFMIGFNVVLSP